MSNITKHVNLSLEELEGSSNEVLNRIVGELNNRDTQMAHVSHSSSSGRGHSSYVSGAGQGTATKDAPADVSKSEASVEKQSSE